MLSPSAPQPKQCQRFVLGLTEKEGVRSEWNGQQHQYSEPFFCKVTCSEMTSTMSTLCNTFSIVDLSIIFLAFLHCLPQGKKIRAEIIYFAARDAYAAYESAVAVFAQGVLANFKLIAGCLYAILLLRVDVRFAPYHIQSAKICTPAHSSIISLA